MSSLVETIDTDNDRVKIEIHYDSDPECPRGWDNLAVMLCAHRRHTLGDEQLSSDCNGWQGALHKWAYENIGECQDWVNHYLQVQYEHEYNTYLESLGPDEDDDQWYDSQWWADNGIQEGEPHQTIAKWLEDNAVVNNLYLYDHSGITISNSPFSCNWDSGQVGFILLLKSKALAELTCDKMNWREAAQRCIDGEVEVYDDYLTGEVYGYWIKVDGEHEESCWGYYGYDHEKSGLMEQAREAAKYEIKQLAKEAAEAAYWAARDVVTV